ncbi:MAG TPA: hypothetical protein VLE89_02295 [Chlamydiales bacterium]|nr:hypothetical protein [Chlamydiales bacterium]
MSSIESTRDRVFLDTLLSSSPKEISSKNAFQNQAVEYPLLLRGVGIMCSERKKKRLRSFDANPGDGNCHVRSFEEALSAKEHLKFDELQRKVSEIAAKWKEFQRRNPVETWEQKPFQSILEENGFRLELSPKSIHTLLSLFLTITKIEDPFNPQDPYRITGYTDFEKLSELGPIKPHKAKALIHGFRKELSKSTVSFMREIVEQLPDAERYRNIFSDKFVSIDKGRMSLPLFPSMEAITDLLHQHRIPIVVAIEVRIEDREFVQLWTDYFYHPTISSDSTRPKKLKELQNVALVFHMILSTKYDDVLSTDELEAHLQRTPLRDRILLPAAAHVQYPNPEPKNNQKEDLIPLIEAFCEKLRIYREKADQLGFSTKNPSQPILTHVFCDNVINLGFFELELSHTFRQWLLERDFICEFTSSDGDPILYLPCRFRNDIIRLLNRNEEEIAVDYFNCATNCSLFYLSDDRYEWANAFSSAAKIIRSHFQKKKMAIPSQVYKWAFAEINPVDEERQQLIAIIAGLPSRN